MKKKFFPAFRGAADALKDRGILTQFVLGAAALVFGVLLGLETAEWIAVILCITLVITAETFNTCIERLCDLVKKEQDERIRYIKDLSAGAVLFASAGALCTALVLLYTHLR